MDLRIDSNKLNIERMRQLVELADCGVLVDEDSGLMKRIQPSEDKKRKVTKNKSSKNPYFKKPVRYYILNAKKNNVAYSLLAKRVNKKFETSFTARQVKKK